MRLLPFALALVVAADVRAETLTLDTDLMVDVSRAVAHLPPLLPDGPVVQADDRGDDDEEAPRRRRRRDDDGDRDRDSGGAFGGGGGGSSFSPMGRPFGIGLQLGFPTALILKYMVTGDQAIAGGIGVGSAWVFDPGLSIHVDYLWHPSMLASAAAFNLSWYVGGGGWVSLFTYYVRAPYVPGYRWYGPSNVWLGARVPIGVNLALREVPFEAFIEAAPAILLFPFITFGLGFSIGARFYI
jgi:hypothetical protein